MPPETPKFSYRDEGEPENYEAAHRMIDEFERKERAQKETRKKDIEEFRAWLGAFVAQHAVGKDPGRSVTYASSIKNLVEAAFRDEVNAHDGRRFDDAKKLSSMIEKLKNPAFVPPEARTVGEIDEALRSELERITPAPETPEAAALNATRNPDQPASEKARTPYRERHMQELRLEMIQLAEMLKMLKILVQDGVLRDDMPLEDAKRELNIYQAIIPQEAQALERLREAVMRYNDVLPEESATVKGMKHALTERFKEVDIERDDLEQGRK